MSFSLNDAVSHYRSIADTTHKFWGYFQAIAAGTAAFAWTGDTHRGIALTTLLTAAFLVFALPNWRLVIGSQRQAVSAASAIKAYCRNHADAINTDLRPIIDTIDRDPVYRVGLWHTRLSTAVVLAVWARVALGI